MVTPRHYYGQPSNTRRFTALSWSSRRWKRFSSGRWERKSMREAWLIARREYLERIRSRAFRISTVLIPLFFALIFGAGALSGKLSGGGARHIIVASNDPL